MDPDLIGAVAAVHRSDEHTFSKATCESIELVGDGVMKMMFIDDPDNPDGPKIGRTGVIGVVITGGTAAAGDAIKIRFPAGPLTRMEKV